MWYEPDFDVSTPESSGATGNAGQKIPWSVAAIGATQSWAVSGDGTGSVDVDVYVLDTGVAQAQSDDPNDDLALYDSRDFREGLNDAKDKDGHGTHIAGIIGAVDDNDNIVGIAPGARIHNYKVLNDDGRTDVSVVIAAVEHLLQIKLTNPSKPMVVNMFDGIKFSTRPDVFVFPFVSVFFVSVFASIYPSLKVYGYSPVTAMRKA